MGFRDIDAFNQALLAKQKVGNNPSFTWRSLLWGRDLLKQGIHWRVGSGRSVSIFRDPCLSRPSSFRPITPANKNTADWMVEDLITNREVIAWQWSCVKEKMFPETEGGSDGTILGCQAKKIHGSFCPFMALKEGLLIAKDCGICIQIAEVDATQVVQTVNCGDLFAEEGAVINDILELFSIAPQ
ncbi:hypothetical protein TIFTF001_028862 [Ficus carica]|uniref:Uncharacterized protein n=1 Tax=Ficus carica TaxID=3494 RepID=A0AA88DR42_FICCA|nr:hypothetical protein TIFTF001_028862 [Ficus carica]